jgi:xanthine dehydrogenase accessory factor
MMKAVAELFDHIDELRKTGGRVCGRHPGQYRGTTPRKEGAKMVVGEAGKVLGSVTIGGCVDAQVIEEAEDVLTSMRPRLLEMNLGDEEAWEIGLTCGGTIEVFVEPMALDQTDDTAARFYDRVRDHASRGGIGAVVTRLDSDGGKLLVLDDGTIEGPLGDPGMTESFVAEARTAIGQGASRTAGIEGVRAFLEVVAPPALLVVVGANHVAMPLTTLARTLGYRTVVIDGRPRFATRERFPDVDDLKIGIPSELITDYPLVRSTALVLVAHDYKYELPVLHYALARDVGYIGMLGSSRRGAAILKLLREDGVDEASLARVRVPIGLDLGAKAAPEIALAVLAEIQAVRGGGTGLPMSKKNRAGNGKPATDGHA